MSVQQSLGAFTTEGWELVDEKNFEEGVGYRCPDCGQSLDAHYWPFDGGSDDDYVHGMGCMSCQTVVPFSPPSELRSRMDVGNDRITVSTRSGKEIDIGVRKANGGDR